MSYDFPTHILIYSMYKDSEFHWPSLGHLQIPLIKTSSCTGLRKLPHNGKEEIVKENQDAGTI